MDTPTELTDAISVQEVQRLCEGDEDFLLVDCREPEEYEIVHLEQAKLIPMRETPNRLHEFEAYKNKRVVVHCHHGGRSQRVVDWLREKGFTGAQNMTGGIDLWSQDVDPSLPRY